MAYHQGTEWPWLLGHFVEAYLKLHGKSGLTFIRNLFLGFEPALTEYGVGTIAEIYDGDPPHTPRGAISQAWSVAELLRIGEMIRYYEEQEPDESDAGGAKKIQKRTTTVKPKMKRR